MSFHPKSSKKINRTFGFSEAAKADEDKNAAESSKTDIRLGKFISSNWIMKGIIG